MRAEYEIEPLPSSQRNNPESQRAQLLALLYQVQEQEPEWFEAEALGALGGALELQGFLLTLERLKPERLVDLWQVRNPKMSLTDLEKRDPHDVARAALLLLSPE